MSCTVNKGSTESHCTSNCKYTLHGNGLEMGHMCKGIQGFGTGFNIDRIVGDSVDRLTVS